MQLYYDHNPVYRQICTLQGIPVGSQAWKDGGASMFGGQTGGVASYGHNAAHLIRTDAQRRAVISNAAARGFFYSCPEAIAFDSTYELAGRPLGWTLQGPPDPGAMIYDIADGATEHLVPLTDVGFDAAWYQANGQVVTIGGVTYAKVKVTGIECAHWWPTHLVSILRYGQNKNWTVPWLRTIFGFPDNPRPAWQAAWELLVFFAQSVVSEIRHPYIWLNGNGERQTARTIEGALDCYELGAILPRDADDLGDWLRGPTAAFYSAAPGVSLYTNGRISCSPVIPVGVPHWNGWQGGWLGAAFSRANRKRPGSFDVLLEPAMRFLTWCVESTNSAGIFHPILSTNQATLDLWSAAGKAPQSIAPLIASGNVTLHTEYDYALWMYRALREAELRSIPNARARADAVEARFAHNDENAKWFVDADGHYIWPEYATFEV